MKRPIPIVVAVGAVLFVAGAAAQDRAPPAGRYQIAPDDEGFVRLDTETGALSHCRKEAGAWRCAIIAEERSELDRRIAALDDEVASLATEVARLTDRLAVLERKGVTESPPPPTAEEREREFDQALSFAERLMRRFFDMVKELKGEEQSQRI